MEGDKPGDRVRLKRTGEEGSIVHVFATYPFRGDVVVQVGERRELCSEAEIEKRRSGKEKGPEDLSGAQRVEATMTSRSISFRVG